MEIATDAIEPKLVIMNGLSQILEVYKDEDDISSIEDQVERVRGFFDGTDEYLRLPEPKGGNVTWLEHIIAVVQTVGNFDEVPELITKRINDDLDMKTGLQFPTKIEGMKITYEGGNWGLLRQK